jgi:hypothetical protein
MPVTVGFAHFARKFRADGSVQEFIDKTLLSLTARPFLNVSSIWGESGESARKRDG